MADQSWTAGMGRMWDYYFGNDPTQNPQVRKAVGAVPQAALPPGQAAGAPQFSAPAVAAPVAPPRVAPPAGLKRNNGVLRKGPLPPGLFSDPKVPPPVSPEERAGILAMFAGDQDPPDAPPAQPQAPAPAAPDPQAPPVPQATQGRNQQGIYDGMINAGVGLLRGKNMADAIANGFAGFNSAYDARVEKDKEQATPKIVPLADGAFSMLVYPNGQQKVVPNKDIQKYQQDKMAQQAALMFAKPELQADLTLRNKRALADDKLANDADAELQQVSKGIEATQAAIDAAKKQGWTAQLAGKFPTIAGVVDANDAAGNQLLQNASVDAWLQKTKLLKGALSDKEGNRIGTTLPDISANREQVWLPFLQRQLEGLQKAHAFLSQQKSGGRTTTSNGAGAAPSNSIGVSDATWDNYFKR